MTEMRLATTDDDARLRALLRENGMPSWVDMSLAREPSFFAGHGYGGEDWAVLAEDRGELVGMYTAAVRPVHLNGEVRRIGYLGGLRVQPAHRRRIRHLREGYASIPRLAPLRPDHGWWMTVVASDNQPARRLLEAGVAGLPSYRALGQIETLALSTSRARIRAASAPWRPVREDELPQLLAWHARQAQRHQFSPAVDAALLARIGLDHAWVHEDAGAIGGFAVLWDQSAFKQIVARRYAPALRRALPLYNAWARLTGRVRLPPEGHALEQTFIAFLALDPALEDQPGTADALIDGLLARCATPVASLGLHAGHAWLAALRRRTALRYPATVYAVEFDEAARLDGRAVQPEVALL